MGRHVKFTSLLLAALLLVSISARAASPFSDWETLLDASLDWVVEISPDGAAIGGVVGEWAVMAMVRAGRGDADCPWVRGWLDALAQDGAAEVSALRRWTDYQRVVLALDALGLDATDFHGRDFTAPFRAFVPVGLRGAMNRTVLADIFALRALDAVGANSRMYLAHVLHLQRADGSWGLNAAAPSTAGDVDVTAMAVQALAVHYARGDARAVAAVGRALEWLAAQEIRDAEGAAQVLTALVMLGEAHAEAAQNCMIVLMTWYNYAAGGFVRPGQPTRMNAMATVQAAYALSWMRYAGL